ncbi:hypothetical protein Anacy_0835 [Anabaena cylindrica PCC 7122]|uniref:Uncharacterized protein n=1 Tax=Anabaena cylindrica (strain ATCC 27899 / PCC 7122) TaxID=272123 RepID=K9ZCG3_ANACC|nr:hypothetical protein Anacy_0835 [Anabaena cylindrica PCC 7122]BAY01143.1 hypothetical protein NIES19_03730 [Anabaena cylindrica PCC 7122]
MTERECNLKVSIVSEVMGQTKKAKITFTCSHELREELESIANVEDRTLSNLVERIITRAVKSYKPQDQKAS